jgi:hypothetical protein
MVKTPIHRHEKESTWQELARSLEYIIDVHEKRYLTGTDLSDYLNKTKFKNTQKPLAKQCVDTGDVLALICETAKQANPAAGIVIKSRQAADDLSVDFVHSYCRVFNEDIRCAPDIHAHGDLWQTLRQTQFRRSIAKFSSFSTSNVTRLIQSVENSTALRYEGQPFNYRMFLTKRMEHLKKPLGNAFMKFAKAIPYEQALMAEHWIRATVDGGEIGLIALGHNHRFIGMFNVPTDLPEKPKWIYSPHKDLVALQELLVDGTALFIVSEHGDIYILLPNGATFWRTQGRWRFLSYAQLKLALSISVTPSLVTQIMRIALDLSYERHGALIVVLDDTITIRTLVKDHGKRKRANEALRQTMKGIKLSNLSHLKAVVAACKSDGALVLSSDGTILDVACMVSDPPETALKAVGLDNVKKFPGARSTAAWNASIFGTAIKISEDGPITAYHHGKEISAIG